MRNVSSRRKKSAKIKISGKEMKSEAIKRDITRAWRRYIQQVEFSLGQLEREIQKTWENAAGRIPEERIQHVDGMIKEIYDIVFSIGEPKWANRRDAELIRNLKRRVYQFDSQFHQLKRRLPYF